MDSAVRAQLDDGVILSLPHPLETEVAERIVELVPCAEMVRFGKNGSDATSGAIRIARAFTGRDRVAVCGYHGWQDWYIGSTARHLGVPQATRDLTHGFAYNDLESLERVLAEHKGEFAAIILEPMNLEWPKEGFLEGVRELATREGAVLVFDETITGFRYAMGGAHFSFTFGGELLSLAAARAVLDKLQREPVLDRIAALGSRLQQGLVAIIEEHQLAHIFAVKGHPSWSFLTIADAPAAGLYEMKTMLMQELHERGFLSVGSHNISYAHSDADIDALLAAYREILPAIGRAAAAGDVKAQLRGETLVPLFKVR